MILENASTCYMYWFSLIYKVHSKETIGLHGFTYFENAAMWRDIVNNLYNLLGGNHGAIKRRNLKKRSFM
jgi:hypothetical protein